MFKSFILSFFIMGVTMSQTSDEQFIIDNMEMLEALDMLDSDVEVEQLTLEEKTFANTESKAEGNKEDRENEKDF